MEKQPSTGVVRNQVTETIEPRVPSLSNDEVEEFRAYFSEKMSILHKSGKQLEETESRLASGESEEQDEDTEDEEMEEQLGKAGEPRTESVLKIEEAQEDAKEGPVQFLVRDDDEEDGPDADFLTVKRRDVFGLDLKENQALSVSLLQMESSLASLLCANCSLCKVMRRTTKRSLG